MKIEIHNAEEFGYKVYNSSNNVLIENHTKDRFKLFWQEEDIFELLTEAQYKQFENGEYEFNVSKKDIFRVSQNNTYY